MKKILTRGGVELIAVVLGITLSLWVDDKRELSIIEKNNIKYANIDATDEEILHVAKLSYCDEFIELLPKKYDTIIFIKSSITKL